MITAVLVTELLVRNIEMRCCFSEMYLQLVDLVMSQIQYKANGLRTLFYTLSVVFC